MNKFVKTFQKLTALFIILNSVPKEAMADKVGEWHRADCNSGIFSACIRFPNTSSVIKYPSTKITTKRYLFPRDNPVSTTRPIDMAGIINALGERDIKLDAYRIPSRGVTGSNSCFAFTYRVDPSAWNIVQTREGTAFQLKRFPLLGFILKIRTTFVGPANFNPGNNQYKVWKDITQYEVEFPTACSQTAELKITPEVKIKPLDLSRYVPIDFAFKLDQINTNGEFELNLQNTFFGAFSLDGRYGGTAVATKVTSDGGVTVEGSNVTIRLNAVTCNIEGGANHTRDFGTKKSSEITAPIKTSDVDIRVNCGSNAYINPWIVFTDANNLGNRSDTLKMIYKNNGAQTANVGIKLKQKNGNYISFGPDSPKKGTQNQIKLTKEFPQQNTYIISFTPELIKLDNSKKIEGGELEGRATYTLSYQ
ncbi:TPA: fimbrial protein [Haemophilus influenzae]